MEQENIPPPPLPPPPSGRYKPHMQSQTPAANSQDKFHISPQEASDFTNISHSKIYQKVKRTKNTNGPLQYTNYAMKSRPNQQKSRSN